MFKTVLESIKAEGGVISGTAGVEGIVWVGVGEAGDESAGGVVETGGVLVGLEGVVVQPDRSKRIAVVTSKA